MSRLTGTLGEGSSARAGERALGFAESLHIVLAIATAEFSGALNLPYKEVMTK